MVYKKAMFGGGPFWYLESIFRRIQGIVDTAVGYAGGSYSAPTYEDVQYKDTGHAEVVLLEYDPSKISYSQLLETFWRIHDPTQINRQGPDIGEQYRSVIFTLDEEQHALAETSKAEQDHSRRFLNPIVTQILPATAFWRAEDYHQRYLEKRGQRIELPPGIDLQPQEDVPSEIGSIGNGVR